MTRARISRVLDLPLLAPDIQEEVLPLEAPDGPEPLPERELHNICHQPAWAGRRRSWQAARPA